MSTGGEMSNQNATFLEVEISGPGVTRDDAMALRNALSDFPNVRVSGAWAPAAVPDAVQIVAGFFALRLAEFILTKGFEALWSTLSNALSAYRETRKAGGKQVPMLSQLVVRAADCEVVVTTALEPGSPVIVHTMELLAERLTSGLLAAESIQRIELPCIIGYEGQWETVMLDDESTDVDFGIWHIIVRDVNGHYGYYDARADAWIDQTLC